MAVLVAWPALAAATVTPTTPFPLGTISERSSHEIAALDRVASALAERRVTVDCWSTHDWEALLAWTQRHGYSLREAAALTNPKLAQIQIAPYMCETFAALFAHRPAGLLYTAFAVGVLAHESAHAAGTRAEGRAECQAVRTLPRAAQLLGFSATAAVRLQRVFWGTIYPADLPQYRTPVCPLRIRGIVVADETGPAAIVRPLRAVVAAVGAGPGGLRRLLPAEPGGLSSCAAIRSRSQELARVVGRYADGSHVELDVSAVTFRTPAVLATVWARVPGSFTCNTAQHRDEIKSSDPAATVVGAALPARIARLSAHVRGYRLTTRSHTVSAGKTVIVDTVFIEDPGRSFYAVVGVKATGVPVPLLAEARAVEAVLHAR